MKYWITKEGSEFKISEMATSHIRNCLKAVKDGRVDFGEYYYDAIDSLEKELEHRDRILLVLKELEK
jgi:hypothetical protein